MAGGIAWVIMAIIVSIGEEVANSKKQALYEENKLLNKDNVYF